MSTYVRTSPTSITSTRTTGMTRGRRWAAIAGAAATTAVVAGSVALLAPGTSPAPPVSSSAATAAESARLTAAADAHWVSTVQPQMLAAETARLSGQAAAPGQATAGDVTPSETLRQQLLASRNR